MRARTQSTWLLPRLSMSICTTHQFLAMGNLPYVETTVSLRSYTSSFQLIPFASRISLQLSTPCTAHCDYNLENHPRVCSLAHNFSGWLVVYWNWTQWMRVAMCSPTVDFTFHPNFPGTTQFYLYVISPKWISLRKSVSICDQENME